MQDHIDKVKATSEWKKKRNAEPPQKTLLILAAQKPLKIIAPFEDSTFRCLLSKAAMTL